MSQGTQSIPNESGASFRASVNTELQALASTSSGSAAPATTWAYQLWADTTNGLLKQRNAANSGWLIRGTLAESFVISKSADFSVGLGDFGRAFVCTAALTASVTACATLGDGFEFTLRNDSSGAVVIDPNGSETVDGATTATLQPGETCLVHCNGTNLVTSGRTLTALAANAYFVAGAFPEFVEPTMAALTALTGLQNGMRFRTAGRFAVADGGQLSYYWDASDNTTADGFLHVALGIGGTGRLRPIFVDRMINARAAGCHVDGGTDDSTAVATFLAGLSTLSGATGIIDGSMVVSGSIGLDMVSNANLMGTNPTAEIKYTGTGIGVRMNTISRATLKHLLITCTNAAAQGAYLYGLTYGDVFDLTITGAVDGLVLQGDAGGHGFYYSRVARIRSHGNSRDGVVLSSVAVAATQYVNAEYLTCIQSDHNGRHGLNLAAVSSHTFASWQIEQNTGNAINLGSYCTYNIGIGIYAENNTAGLMNDYSADTTIQGNFWHFAAVSAGPPQAVLDNVYGNVFRFSDVCYNGETQYPTNAIIHRRGNTTYPRHIIRPGDTKDVFSEQVDSSQSLIMSWGPGGSSDTDVTLYRVGTKRLGCSQLFHAQQGFTQAELSVSSASGVLALTDTAAIFVCTLTENITSVTPPTAVGGKAITLQFLQAASGGPYTVTLGSSWTKAGASYTMTGTAGKTDVLKFRYNVSLGTWLEEGRSQNL